MTDIWTAGRPAKAQVIKEPAWAGEKREAPLSVVGLQIRLRPGQIGKPERVRVGKVFRQNAQSWDTFSNASSVTLPISI